MTRCACLAAFALLAACGQLQTGGFETTDLQARVVRPDGAPVASARAWLVRSRGDTAPAVVLDSGFSDEAGRVRFAIPADGQGGLGIDVRSGDSLGIAPRVFASVDTARVVVTRAHTISVPADSIGSATCYVPGSHFVSELGSDGSTAKLVLPSGSWNVAIRRGSTVLVAPLRLETDTVLSTRDVLGTMDTTAQANARVLAARTTSTLQEGLVLDVVNHEATAFDSLTIRIYMDGSSSEMSDFAVRLDIAQLHSAEGFSKQVSLDADRWRETVPVPVDPSCPATSTCSWSIDLPLDGATIGTDERLRASLLFDRHILSGDSLRYSQSRPTHDPFSGSDWSFRARTWSDSAAAPPGMPDYGGVPIALATDLPEAAPYIVLLRKRRLISGKAPSNKS